MKKGTSSARLVGNDEHVSRHPHQWVLVKISLVMKTFEKNKDQRIGEPAWHRQHTDNLEQRYKEDQVSKTGATSTA